MPTTTTTTTVILGAGIIGVSTAYYLATEQQQLLQLGGSTVHLVEPSPELFASASGFAGGFLARDWFSPATAGLGALSFDEHRRLADSDGGGRRWGYVDSTCVSFSKGARSAASGDREKVDVWCRDGASRAEAAAATGTGEPGTGTVPPWLRVAEGDSVDVISEEGTVAQVDPRQFCQHLLQKCLAAGVRLHHPARAVAVHTDALHGEISGVRIADAGSGAETDVPCTRILVAAGAWSPQAFAALFPTSAERLPISSLAGHSIVVRSPRWGAGGAGAGGEDDDDDEEGGENNRKNNHNKKEGEGEGKKERKGLTKGPTPRCHAVFMTAAPGYAPEIFSRANGHIYVAGLNSADDPLPPLPTDARARVRSEAVARLRGTARRVIHDRNDEDVEEDDDDGDGGGGGGDDDDDDDGLEVVRESLCFRPTTARGTPILDRIPDAWLGPSLKTRPGGAGGVFLAAGHGPWGISQALGTGKVMAEMMVQGRALSADVSALRLEA